MSYLSVTIIFYFSIIYDFIGDLVLPSSYIAARLIFISKIENLTERSNYQFFLDGPLEAYGLTSRVGGSQRNSRTNKQIIK